MASPDELLKQGDIAGARAALVEEVRSNPDSRPARMFLSQVLLVLGEWDKALTHMKALAKLSPEALTFFTAYDRAVTAEKSREAVFAGLADMPALVEGGAWFDVLRAAISREAKGDVEGASKLRQQAYEEAPETPGETDGVTFEALSDTDARFGPSLEVILDGRYGLIPFSAIATLESEGAKDLRDLVWLPVRLTLKSGQAGTAMLPARYPGAATDADPSVKLARKTDWDDHGDLGNWGRGQHVFDADGAEIDLLALRRLTFTA